MCGVVFGMGEQGGLGRGVVAFIIHLLQFPRRESGWPCIDGLTDSRVGDVPC